MSARTRFIKKVQRRLRKRGLVPPYGDEIDGVLYDAHGKFKNWPSKKEAVQLCIEKFDLTLTPSAHEFLAVHEAGHAIVGLRLDVPMMGVRFHDGGDSGITVFMDLEWKHTTDVRLLKRLIAIDVAGLVAEQVLKVPRPDGSDPGDLLSTWYDGRLAANPPRPQDFQLAHHRAHQLDYVVNKEQHVTLLEDPAGWPAKKTIIEGMEKLADKILRNNIKALQLLADSLMKGPLTTKAIKKLVGELK